MFENPRRGRQARNFTTNVPKILDLKSSSEQIFSENWRWVPLIYLWESLAVDRPTYLKPGTSLLWLVKSSCMKRWHLQLGFSMYPAKYCNEITIKSDKTFLVYKYRRSNASNNWWSLWCLQRKGWDWGGSSKWERSMIKSGTEFCNNA